MTKAQWREKMLALRAAMSPQERSQASIEIAKKATSFIVEDDVIFVFLTMGEEVDTAPFFEKYKNTCIPKCFKGGLMKAIGEYTNLEKTAFGPMEPTDGVEVENIDVAIVPGLAFSSEFNRIGYGAGFYDGFLQKHPDIFKIGVCYDFQIIDGFPVEAHDQKVDCIITEKRILLPEEL